MAGIENEQYVKYVSIGKELVKKLEALVQMENCYQATIAKMAVEVCTIRHGGISKIKEILELSKKCICLN